MKTVIDPVSARFPFGANWASFLPLIDENRVAVARASLERLFGDRDLSGKRFLDVGCGSGLFSLAANLMGAQVTSFDFDAASLECARELQRRFGREGTPWTFEQGSVLDATFLARLGTFDFVYAWGVLHHTGALWSAVENALALVGPNGSICVAIYNYQPYWTRIYTAVKWRYASSGALVRRGIYTAYAGYQVCRGFMKDLFTLTSPLARYRSHRARGMSLLHDWKDWIGGYPFEAATPETVFDFVSSRGFVLTKLRTCGGFHGCNEFVFRRSSVGVPPA